MSVSSEPLTLNLNWDQNSWLFTIKDNGPGLGKEFELPHSPMSSEQGMGIGLLLSHSSIQRLGGKVTLSNDPAQGCLTEVAMPINKTEMI